MRRITLWSLSTLTTLVLLFSYHTSTSSKGSTLAAPVIAQAATPAAVPTPETTTSTDSSTAGSTSGSSGGSASGSSGTTTDTPGSSSSSSSSSSASSAAKTYAGAAIGTRYGDVQVQITVKSGKITASAVLQVPWNDHKDQEINSYAVPILNQEAVASQSSTIDMVSGATYTSDGYIQSLQSAIDQAHL